MKYFSRHYLLFYSCIVQLFIACGKVSSKAKPPEPSITYTFSPLVEVPSLPVVNQHASGTCWAFSTTSFLETEILRIKNDSIDLSEMYFVRNVYISKTRNFVMRQGTARFSEGGCNHDPVITLAESGLVPQAAYTGHLNGDTIYDHRKLFEKMEPRVKAYANPANKLGADWKIEVPALLDEFIGKTPATFSYSGNQYTPISFLAYTQLRPVDYINITSFTHIPPDRPFILTIPANWANEPYYNVSLEEYMAIIDHALESGYSLTIDLDISEKDFSIDQGVAVLSPGKAISPEQRQSEFENFTTTDDHNMHLVGKAKDQYGNIYYKCKNSWGPSLGRNGFIYLGAAYVKMKSISVMLHKDGLTKAIRQQLRL
jgi:bleomycin hydrolase